MNETIYTGKHNEGYWTYALQTRPGPRTLPLWDEQTLANTAYRRVIETRGGVQMVAMNLLPCQVIKNRAYHRTTMVIHVIDGRIMVRSDNLGLCIGKKDSYITITPGENHLIRNLSGSDMLKISILFTPPIYPPELFEKTQPEEDEAM